MQKVIIIIIFLFVKSNLSAQIEDNQSIRLSVIAPENLDGFNQRQISRLNSKLIDIVSQSGFSGDGKLSSKFVIYPKLLLNRSYFNETGVFKVYSVDIDVTFVVMQHETKNIFLSTTINQTGDGNSSSEAIDNAISGIKINDKKLNEFFSHAKTKIIDYFDKNCDKILSSADNYVNQKNYEAALSILFSIPAEVACFTKVKNQIQTTFLKYQNSKCSEQINYANSKFSQRDFHAALEALGKIDIESKCKNQVIKLMNECFKNISEDEKTKLENLKEAYYSEKDLEIRRMSMARDIAIEYYKSKSARIEYNNLIIIKR
jgi:hypothetical protein